MRRSLLCLLRPSTSGWRVPTRKVGLGRNLAAMAYSSTATGKTTTPWHGAGAAEYDLRSEFFELLINQFNTTL